MPGLTVAVHEHMCGWCIDSGFTCLCLKLEARQKKFCLPSLHGVGIKKESFAEYVRQVTA